MKVGDECRAMPYNDEYDNIRVIIVRIHRGEDTVMAKYLDGHFEGRAVTWHKRHLRVVSPLEKLAEQAE